MTVQANELVGRTAELAIFDERLARAHAGRCEVLFLEGEGGIGKSALLASLLDRARAQGFEVFFGGCEQLERHRSLGPIVDALGDRAPSVLAKPAAVGAGGPGEGSMVEALGDLLESLAVKGPVALAVDDLHWADASTIYALRSLGKRLTFQPALIAASFRPLPRVAELDQLVRGAVEDGAAHIRVEPLDAEAVGQLLHLMLGAPAAADLRAFASRAAGNPLFVRELVAGLTRDEAIAITEGEARVSREAIPPDLRVVLLRHVGSLSHDAIQLLRTASIIGTEFSPVDLSATAGRPVAQLLGSIDEWTRAGLVESEGARLRFRHDLIREALYEDLPDGVRRALHLDAARALTDSAAPLLTRAQHYALGAVAGDQAAFDTLVEAANRAARSPISRAELLEKALTILDDDSEGAERARSDLADALILAGKPREGRELANSILEGQPREEIAAAMRFALARSLSIEARWEELVDVTARWLEGSSLGERERALMLAHRAQARIMSAGDKQEAASDATTALSIGERIDDDLVSVLACIALMLVCDVTGRYEEEVRYARRAVAIVERNPRPEVQQLHPHVYLGLALDAIHEPEEADRAFADGLRLRERLGSVWDLPLYMAAMAHVHERYGRWDDAVAEAEACLTTADEVNTRVGVVVAHLSLGRIAFYQGDLKSAGRHARSAEAMIGAAGMQWGHPAELRLRLIAAKGDAEGVVRAASDVRPGLLLRLLSDCVPLLLSSGRRAEAERLIERAEMHLEVEPHPFYVALGHLGRGLLDDEPALLLRAREIIGPMGYWEAAVAAEYAAACLARRDRMEEAGELFREALETYAGLDAGRLITRTQAAMRAVGARGWKRQSRVRARIGWDALTSTERRIVDLVSEGLTNPQIGERLFISRRTVQSHLRHVFAKLDIASRTELAATVARRTRNS